VAFDALVAALYGDVVAFEAAEEAKIAAENARHAAVRPTRLLCHISRHVCAERLRAPLPQTWTGMSAALAAQRARTDAAFPDARRGPRVAKRPKWGDDAYDDYADLDEDDESDEEDRRRTVRRGAHNGNHPDDEGDLGPNAPWVRAPAAAKHRPVMAPPPPPPPPDPFPAATAMARGLPGAPAVVHVRVCPAEDASPETILPELSAPYLCVPYDMTVRDVPCAMPLRW
jgi:hypothetical protein